MSMFISICRRPAPGKPPRDTASDTKEKITTSRDTGGTPRATGCRRENHLVRPRPSHRRISSRPPTQLRLARTHGTHEHETEIDFPVGVRSLFHVGPTPQPPIHCPWPGPSWAQERCTRLPGQATRADTPLLGPGWAWQGQWICIDLVARYLLPELQRIANMAPA